MAGANVWGWQDDGGGQGDLKGKGGRGHLSVCVTSASSGFFPSKSDWRHSCLARPFFCEIDFSTHAAARYSFWLSAIAGMDRPRGRGSGVRLACSSKLSTAVDLGEGSENLPRGVISVRRRNILVLGGSRHEATRCSLG